MRAILPLLLLAGSAVPASAKTELLPPPCPVAFRQPLFLSPVGEPFRAKSDDDDPVRRWFEQVDSNRDGQLTMAEMLVDADRFFALLDKDRSGELLPDEVHAYEENMAPEIRLYQRRPDPAPGDKTDPDEQRKARPKGKRGAAPGYDGAQGAGRYAFLNIPNPIASADRDYNRAVDLKEFRATVAERFRDLDTGQTRALTLAALPKTPAQKLANLACLARAKESAKTRGDRR